MWLDASTRLLYGGRHFQKGWGQVARSEKSRMPKPSKRLDRRKTTSTRIKPEVRSQLERRLAVSPIPGAEIELRLEQSFVEYDARLRGFGSEERLPLLRALGLAVEMVEMTTGKNISTDAEPRRLPTRQCTGLLTAYSAPGQVDPGYSHTHGGPGNDPQKPYISQLWSKCWRYRLRMHVAAMAHRSPIDRKEGEDGRR